jgi:small nuclear ribonucleoprotein (snRNP)-like protein
MLVELKNGETLNGHLVTCDNWMNLILREVVQTSPEGDKFFRLPEVYIRGNNVRTLCAQDSDHRADYPARSNTSESPKRLSKLLRSSKQTNHRADAVVTETVGASAAVAAVVVAADVAVVVVGAVVLVVLVAHKGQTRIAWLEGCVNEIPWNRLRVRSLEGSGWTVWSSMAVAYLALVFFSGNWVTGSNGDLQILHI